MGIAQLGKLALNYTKTIGKHSILQTKPQALTKLDTVGLKYASNLEGDVVQFSNKTFRKLSPEQTKVIMEREGLHNFELLDKSGKYLIHSSLGKELITENNSMFLEELMKLYPKVNGSVVNTDVQKIMLCLRDIDHSSFKDKKEFLNMFINDIKEIEKMTTKEGDILYKETETAIGLLSKKAILDAKYNDKETYQDIMDLYKLYKEGKAPKYAIRMLFPGSKMHALPKSDMQKLLKGESYYPKLSNLSEPNISKLETGEAFSVGKEMYVKTSTGYDKLKIDAETYEKLFPPIERYTLAQNGNNNCHFMATLDAITKNPESRIDLYKLFEQVEGGVKCTIKGYPENGIIYKLDDLEQLYGEFNVLSSPAHKMLENTYAESLYLGLKKEFGAAIDFVASPDNHLSTLDRNGIYENVEGYLKDLIGKNSKTVSMLNEKLGIKEKNVVLVPNAIKKDAERGVFPWHYYSVGDLEKGTIINPWNTAFEIKQNPFDLSDITYAV